MFYVTSEAKDCAYDRLSASGVLAGQLPSLKQKAFSPHNLKSYSSQHISTADQLRFLTLTLPFKLVFLLLVPWYYQPKQNLYITLCQENMYLLPSKEIFSADPYKQIHSPVSFQRSLHNWKLCRISVYLANGHTCIVLLISQQ